MSIEDPDSALQIVEAGRLRVLARLRDAVEAQVRAHAELAAIDSATIDQLVEEAFPRAGSSLWRISLAEGAGDEFGIGVREALSHPSVAAAEQLIGVEPDDGLDPTASWPLEDAQDPWPEWAGPDAGDELGEAAPDPTPPATPATLAGAPGQAAPTPAAAEPGPAPAPEPAPQPEPAPPTAAAEPVPVLPAPEPPPAAPAVAPAPVLVVAEPLRMAAVHTGGIESLKSGDKDIELRLSDAGLDVLKRSSGAALGRLDWTMITGIDVAEPKRGRRRKRRAHSLQIHTSGGEAAFELSELSPEEVDSQLHPTLGRLRDAGLLAS